jgi:hypothetical protein
MEEEAMAQPNGLNELRERLEEKLGYTRRLIAEYEETMDYASHCNLLGFAEGIEFVMEEIVEVLKGKDGRQEPTKSRTESKGKVMGNKQEKPGAGKREAQGKPRSKGGKRVTG